MSRHSVITGLGTITGLGIGIDALWEAVLEGRSAIRPIQTFDPAGFASRVAAEVDGFRVNKFVPKHHRKAAKVMARDIALAVGAADQAVRDAGVVTPGVDPDGERTYPPERTGTLIGSGLIAAEQDELTEALAQAVDDEGRFDIRQWGESGMHHLTPLWLLKYLPNMLACHMTIIHQSQGPSNTITCAEASSGLSVGEADRVIQRNKAELCFSGGAESKLNPMAFFRQELTGRLAPDGEEAPTERLRPFDRQAAGTVIGEGASLVMLEEADAAARRGATAYARLAGFGASHCTRPRASGLAPDPEGRGIASSVRAALRDARLAPSDVDLVVPFGSGIPDFDQAEAAALGSVFGERAREVALWPAKPFVGNCGAAAGGIEIALACKMLENQVVPPVVNCEAPIDGVSLSAKPARSAELSHVLVVVTSLGGQNASLVLSRA